MASNEASKTVPVSDNIPNKRERASAQFGQLDGLTAANWAGSTPTSIKNAIERMAALLKTLNSNTPIP